MLSPIERQKYRGDTCEELRVCMWWCLLQFPWQYPLLFYSEYRAHKHQFQGAIEMKQQVRCLSPAKLG